MYWLSTLFRKSVTICAISTSPCIINVMMLLIFSAIWGRILYINNPIIPITITQVRKIPWILFTFNLFMKSITNESSKYAIINAYIAGLKEFITQLNVPGLNTINKIISAAIKIGNDNFKILLYLSMLLPPLHNIGLASVHYSKFTVYCQ